MLTNFVLNILGLGSDEDQQASPDDYDFVDRDSLDDDSDFDNVPEPYKFSFSACGWLKIWLFGVGKALQMRGVTGSTSNRAGKSFRFCGSSGGALVASVLALDLNPDEVVDFALKCVKHCRAKPIPRLFRLREYVISCVESFRSKGALKLPLEEDKLAISVSILPNIRNEMITTFPDGENDLLEALVASSTMTPFAGFPFKLRRKGKLNDLWVFDGGLTAFNPSLGKGTVKVSPFFFALNCDLRPSAFIPPYWALFPPPPKEMRNVYLLGIKDGLAWCDKYMESGRRNAEDEEILISSIKDNLPSSPSVLDFAFVLMRFGLLRPVAYLALYAELGLQASHRIAIGTILASEKWRRSTLQGAPSWWPYSIRKKWGNLKDPRKSFRKARKQVELMLNPKLFLKTVPFFGNFVGIPKKNFLRRESSVFKKFGNLL